MAGGINSIAGGGSLILFPALVALGLNPVAANVTNSLAQWPGYLGGVAGFRSFYAGQAPSKRRSTTCCFELGRQLPRGSGWFFALLEGSIAPRAWSGCRRWPEIIIEGQAHEAASTLDHITRFRESSVAPVGGEPRKTGHER